MRSWLTILGIIIGISTIVSLISISQGVRSAIVAQFDALGKNKLIIVPGSEIFNSLASKSYFTKDELEIIKTTAGVTKAAGIIYSTVEVKHSGETKYTIVNGIPSDSENLNFFKNMQNIKISQGRYVEAGERGKAMCGSMLATPDDFFHKPVKVGDSLLIRGKKFEVVGIMEPVGNPSDDTSIAIPLADAEEIFGRKDQYDMIIVESVSEAEVNRTAEAIKKNLRKSRNLKEGKEDFSVQTPQQILESFNSILSAVQIVVLGIAAISIIVGGVGIMNTMYTSVLERTRDIGIMKAVGAKNSDILLLFLIEAGLIGLIGGAIGVFFGFLLSKAIEQLALIALKTNLLKAYFSPILIIGALLFSMAFGMLSGFLPARHASKMKVVESIRQRL
ncbi:MAG: ABC transporter permease [Candidatus Woesearchaeota archaeon]